MLEHLIIIYILLTMFMCFFNIRIGVILYLYYFILLPYNNFYSLNLNSIFPFILLGGYFYNFGLRHLIIKPLLPFVFLYSIELFLIPVRVETPYKTQFYSFFADFTKLILPFVMFNVMHRYPDYISKYSKVLYITIIIVVVYSILLILIPGINPYLSLILPISGGDFLDWYASPEVSGRIFGRISSVFPHPMTNGLFLSLSIIYLLYRIKTNATKQNVYFIILFLLNTLAIFVIGVRTAILAVVISITIYMLLERKLSLLFYTVLNIGIFMLILFQIPEMDTYIKSIYDADASDIGGSSIEMRLEQLNGAFKEIKHNIVFGNGYGWHIYYIDNHGDHPILLGFESLLFVILCNSGIFGVFIWGVIIYWYVNINKKLTNNKILITLFSVYIFYSIITGEYGYMKYFLVFYAIIYMDGIHNSLLSNQRMKM